MNILASANQF